MRAVLFDFGGTLDFPRHWLDRFVAHYRAAGISIERSELAPAFAHATAQAYRSAAELRDYRLTALVEYLLALQFHQLREHGPRPIRRYLEQAAACGRMVHLRSRIRDGFELESICGFAVSRAVLGALASQYRLGVVSNFYGNLDCVLAGAGLADSISVVADSGRLGYYKPDPKIFGAALAKLEAPADQAVMVGDSIAKDCVPAHALGMRTVWLRHSELRGHQAPTGAVDFTIDSLEELNDMIWLRD